MIINTLLLKIKNEEDIQSVIEELMTLDGNIPSLESIRIGKNIRDTGYDIIMVAAYNSLEDMEKYLTHPFHIKVGQAIVGMIEKQASACYKI